MPVYTTVRETLTALNSRWPAHLIADVNGVLQYELSEAPDGDLSQLYVVFVNGVSTVHEGAVEEPDATMWMTAADYVGKVNGTTNMGSAFMTGKLKVTGNSVMVRRLFMATMGKSISESPVGRFLTIHKNKIVKKP